MAKIFFIGYSSTAQRSPFSHKRRLIDLSLSTLDLLQYVVGSIDYGSLLQREKVSSVARRMRCPASNPIDTTVERTMLTKNFPRRKVFSQVFFKKLAGFGASSPIIEEFCAFNRRAHNVHQKLPVGSFLAPPC